MSELGYISIHRQIRDNKIWASEPFSKGQAWVDLIMIANHKERTLFIRGNEVTVKRGQLARSKEKLGREWKWSERKVVNFLKLLEKEGQIKLIKTPSIVVVEIVNYHSFQEKNGQKTDRKRTENGQKTANNNVNNDNNENKPPLPPSENQSTIEGVLKRFRGGNDLILYLEQDDKSYLKAKENAPRWDLRNLGDIWLSGLKERGAPNDIRNAFAGWCLAYTKGKYPS